MVLKDIIELPTLESSADNNFKPRNQGVIRGVHSIQACAAEKVVRLFQLADCPFGDGGNPCDSCESPSSNDKHDTRKDHAG